MVVSVETLRKWMIDAEIWVTRRSRAGQVHQPRRRRSCVGELIQIDGCDHEWFEERVPRCTLIARGPDISTLLRHPKTRLEFSLPIRFAPLVT